MLFLLIQVVSQAVCAQGLNIVSGQDFYNKCLFRTNDDEIRTYVDDRNCFRMDVKKDRGIYRNGFEYKIDEKKDYSISARVYKFDKNAEKRMVACCGIIFGYKDDDNFALFIVNSSEYNIIVKREGLRVFESGWNRYRKDGNIYPFKWGPRLKIVKKGDKLFFAVGEKIVQSMDAFSLSGNMHGFYVDGKGKYGINRFIIKEEDGDSAFASSRNQDVYQKVNDNESGDMKIVGSGTGFLIDKRGYLATNHHVVDGAGAIGVCLRVDGEWKTYNGMVIKDDPTNDLAIIKIEDPNFKEFVNLPYAFSFETEDIGSEIFTLGYPQVQVMGSDVKYTTGVVNAVTGIQGDPTHYQISAHIDHGNSGGPLFNEKGYIIGITDSGLDKATFGDVNYAVKSTYLKVLADALPKKLEFANDKSIALKKRTEQIKTLSQYVALILIAK